MTLADLSPSAMLFIESRKEHPCAFLFVRLLLHTSIYDCLLLDACNPAHLHMS